MPPWGEGDELNACPQGGIGGLVCAVITWSPRAVLVQSSRAARAPLGTAGGHGGVVGLPQGEERQEVPA